MSSSSTLPNNSEETHSQDTHAEDSHSHSHGPVFNPECTRELVIDVPAAEVAAAYRSVAANYRKYAKIPGFRPGKVPDNVVRRRFSADIRKEVIDTLLPQRFNKSVAELGIRPIGQPQVLELTVKTVLRFTSRRPSNSSLRFPSKATKKSPLKSRPTRSPRKNSSTRSSSSANPAPPSSR